MMVKALFRAAVLLALMAGSAQAMVKPRLPFPIPTPRPAPAAVATDPLSLLIDGLANAIKNGSTDFIADTTAADVDAKAHNDDIADQCYTAEIAFAKSITPLANSDGQIGPIELFQFKRDIQNAFHNGVPKSLVMGCGPLFMDETAVLARFAAALAAAGVVIPK